MPASKKRLTTALMNRTKVLVLALFAVYWVFVVVLLAATAYLNLIDLLVQEVAQYVH
jgi:hypothetical protein